MSSPEVDWVLSQFASVADSLSTPLERVDCDETRLLEGGVRSRTEDLQEANLVGATFADVSTEPIGSEYDLSREAVVGVRIEGLHHSEWGHIDPAGTDGVPFDDDGGLVDQLKDALYTERTWPAAGGSNVTYTDLQLANEAPQSSNYADYYRTDFDVVFRGYEDLP